MAIWVRFGKNGSPKGYLNGHKGWWKRAIAKARRRKTKADHSMHLADTAVMD